MPTTTTCSEQVHDDSRDEVGHPCGRPVESDGRCARHRDRKRKQEARTAKWARDAADQKTLLRQVHAFTRELAELGVVDAVAHYDSRESQWSGKVVLDPTLLLPLLRARRVES